MNQRPPPTHFSMIRGFHPADAFTIANAFCGVSRLARYNITAEQLSGPAGKVQYFERTPIPTSLVPLGLLMLAFHHGDLYRVSLLGVDGHLLSLLFLVSGSLMISKTLRIPKP